jgi:hypothetical protein
MVGVVVHRGDDLRQARAGLDQRGFGVLSGPVLDALKEAFLDGWGDVEVGLLDLVREHVAEAQCPGGLGDAVIDHRGLVDVA